MDDLPLITRISEAAPVAAKEHRCIVCGQAILRGERHNRFVYRDDDARDRRTALRAVRYHLVCPPPS